jgi:uncharacterized repeat protein (TIGR02543 family)
MKIYLSMAALWLTLTPLPTVLAQGDQGVVEWNLKSPESRAGVVAQLHSEGEAARSTAWRVAADQGWLSKGSGEGFVYELQAIRNDRLYIYRTMNVNAAISTGANLIWNIAPYTVNGAGETVGIWDGGAVRSTHQELTGRVTVMDGAATIDHATHVAGTIGASGVVPSALGMAPSVQIASYDWNSDLSEMTSRAMAISGATDQIQLSNHSYGVLAGWDTSDGTYKWYGVWGDLEDASFGQYYSTARDWDTLCYSAPYYLPCKASGNDRSDLAPPAGTTFSYYSRRRWITETYDPATDPYSDGYDNGGFDTLEPTSTAKNILTVGAVYDAVSGGSRSLAAAGMTAFSGWRPADDGRVKPDVVGNGYSLYSSLGSGDASYAYYSGTSMATPNVCGSLALLTDYYGQLFPGQCMRASTLKGLVIHTADDLGNAGPDYKFGWGLVNVKAAADVIKLHYDEPAVQHLVEQSLTATTTSRTNSFTWTGTHAIRVTLCWTDPAGAAQTALDSTTKNLVNDLDLRIIGPTGQVYMPYVLVPSTPDVAATTGDNSIDNVEQVYIATPGTSGVCSITVSLHGLLSGASQPYSIIYTVLGALTSTYTVTFDAQGGTTPVPSSTNVTYGSTYGTLATTTRTGYSFDGWWTGTGGTGTQILSTTPVTITAAQTLYAKWTPTATTTTLVPVPYTWLDQYPILLSLASGDYEAMALADEDGDGHMAWQEYVAGTVPTNRESVFLSLISLSNGVPWVTWIPDLGTARVYNVEGRTNLIDGTWGPTNAGSRFFRVNVWMP